MQFGLATRQKRGSAPARSQPKVKLGDVFQALLIRLQDLDSAEACVDLLKSWLGVHEVVEIPVGAEQEDVRNVLLPVLLLSPKHNEGIQESSGKSFTGKTAVQLPEEQSPQHRAVISPREADTIADCNSLAPPTGHCPTLDALEPKTIAEEQEEASEVHEVQGKSFATSFLASYAGKSEVGTALLELLSLPPIPPESEGGPLQRCFVLLEEPAKSLLGKLLSGILTLAILISTAAFVMESMPEFRYRPAECARLRAAGLPLTAEACEPEPQEGFQDVEVVCITIFTLDYVLRMLTVGAECSAVWQGILRTLRYALQPLNVIDLLSILPSYIKLAMSGTGKLGIVQVLRLARILRILKLAKRLQGMRVLGEVMVKSGQPLIILLFFNMIIVLVFGSLIHFAEGQRFSVAPEFTQAQLDPVTNQSVAAPFPTGVYVRSELSLEQDEVTPYRSIPYAIWWVCVTLTTVGYGDFSPTTRLGKAIGVACFYTGVLFIALPFSVMSSNFELVYKKHIKDKEKLEREVMRKKEKMRRQRAKSAARSFWEVPWLPETKSLRRMIFAILEHPAMSKLGKITSTVVMGTIITVTVSFVMESMPEFNQTPAACQDALTVVNCQPQPLPIFYTLETIGIVIFTVDFVLRLLTVHTAAPEECGLPPGRVYSPLKITWAYFNQWMNLVDMLAIVPFYVELAVGPGSSAGTSVMRIFRLVRVFRMLKMPKLSSGVTMFGNIVGDSMPALLLLFSLTLLGCVFFASCLTVAEGSWYSVDYFKQEYPEGLYVRPTKDGHGIEPSPFRSILYSFWWFFTTATTVGYGDDYPTTTAGRVIGVLAAYVGILLMALPVTIVGGNFSKYYADWALGMQDAKGGGGGVGSTPTSATPPMPKPQLARALSHRIVLPSDLGSRMSTGARSHRDAHWETQDRPFPVRDFLTVSEA